MIWKITSQLLIIHLISCPVDIVRKPYMVAEFSTRIILLRISLIHQAIISIILVPLSCKVHLLSFINHQPLIFVRVYFWQHRSNWASRIRITLWPFSKSPFHFDHVFNKNALIMIKNHPLLLHVVILEILVQLACFDHLWLHIDNSIHYLLVLSVNSFRFFFL